MAVLYSPNIVTGLVLTLDAANIRSFKGPPQTNLLTGINYSISNTDTATFKVTNGTLTVNVPKRGQRNVKYVDIFNDYNGGSGNCCPNLFNFGDITVSGNTAYTYSIVYKTATGYSHPNYMYRYEFNGGTYVTEAGVHSTGNRTDLGDGWYHAWGTFTTQATTNRLITYLFHYEYATHNRVFVESIQITQGSYIGAPEHMLEPSQARGTTFATGGGWGDLVNNNHGELVNGPTFNSSNLGNISFDGIDDYVSIPNTTMGNGNLAWTISAWTKTSTTVNGLGLGSIISNASGGPVYSMLGVNSGKIVYWTYQNDAWSQKLGIRTINDNAWHLLTWVNNTNSTMAMYVDGSLDATVANSTSGNNNPLDRIGGSWAGRYSGFIANLSIYKDKALTAAEVLQNYNVTRRRFGL
jgi:hypothetical protein